MAHDYCYAVIREAMMTATSGLDAETSGKALEAAVGPAAGGASGRVARMSSEQTVSGLLARLPSGPRQCGVLAGLLGRMVVRRARWPALDRFCEPLQTSHDGQTAADRRRGTERST